MLYQLPNFQRWVPIYSEFGCKKSGCGLATVRVSKLQALPVALPLTHCMTSGCWLISVSHFLHLWDENDTSPVWICGSLPRGWIFADGSEECSVRPCWGFILTMGGREIQIRFQMWVCCNLRAEKQILGHLPSFSFLCWQEAHTIVWTLACKEWCCHPRKCAESSRRQPAPVDITWYPLELAPVLHCVPLHYWEISFIPKIRIKT